MPDMGVRDRRRPMDDHWRERIQTGVLLDRLAKHANGAVEMTATQVNAAKILLSKTIPDLRAIEHSGELTTHHDRMTDEELNAAIADKVGKLCGPANDAR